MINNKKAKKGFTIVELVIVIAVIAILAAVLIPTFTSVVKNAKESAAISNARNAYTEYLAEVVTDAKVDQSKNVVIAVEGYTVTYSDGEYKATENGSVPSTGYNAYTVNDNTDAIIYVQYELSDSTLKAEGAIVKAYTAPAEGTSTPETGD